MGANTSEDGIARKKARETGEKAREILKRVQQAGAKELQGDFKTGCRETGLQIFFGFRRVRIAHDYHGNAANHQR